MEIVEFAPSQYESLASVFGAAYGCYNFCVDNLRFRDELLATGYVSRRWTAISEGSCIGFGEYSQIPEMNSTDILQMNIVVHPDYQKQGAGTCLYNRIVSDVNSCSPITLRTACRSDNCRSNEFLEHRGFKVGMSTIELNLALGSTKEDIPAALYEGRDGIVIDSMSNLLNDANRDEKLYDLVTSIRVDIPSPSPINPVSFEEFVEGFIAAPSRNAEATFVALEGNSGEYVGISDLFDDGKNGLLAGLTGVRREYRRRGIASAMKQRGVRYARDRGYNCITTFNAVDNSAIGALNRHFGFIEKFMWLHYQKHFQSR